MGRPLNKHILTDDGSSLTYQLHILAAKINGDNTITLDPKIIKMFGKGRFLFKNTSNEYVQAELTDTSEGIGTITVSNGGSGYTSPPTVTFIGGGGSGATAVARLTGTSIASVTVNSSGTNYTSIPTIVFPSPGTAANTTANMKILASSDPVSSGSGYAPNDTIALTGGISTFNGSLIVTSTKVISATIAAGGTGGSDGVQTVTGTTGTGTLFQANVSITGGEIVSVNSITVGGNYTDNPTLLTNEPVTGASLTGAELNISMGVLATTIKDNGQYSVLPSNPVGQGSTTGTGTGFTTNITSYGIDSIVVNSGGSGYITKPSAQISGGGGGSGAALDAVLTPTSIASISVTDSGFGYTSIPTISLSGGGGSGAVASVTSTTGSNSSLKEGQASLTAMDYLGNVFMVSGLTQNLIYDFNGNRYQWNQRTTLLPGQASVIGMTT